MGLRQVQRRGIATVTVVTVDTRQRVDIFRQARLRHKEPRITILPELQLAVAKCTSVLLSRQLGTIRRLRAREINRPARAEDQKQKQRQSSHLRTSDLRHPAEIVFLLGWLLVVVCQISLPLLAFHRPLKGATRYFKAVLQV